MLEDHDRQVDFWAALRALTQGFEEDLVAVYAEFGIERLRPRHVPVLLAIADGEALTIRDLAAAAGVSHSAMSQTITSLRQAGYVETIRGDDSRTKVPRLTSKAEGIIGFVRAEWVATERAMRELDAELPYSLAKLVADLRAATDRSSLRERVTSILKERPEGFDRGVRDEAAN